MTGSASAALLRSDYTKPSSDKPANDAEEGPLNIIFLLQGGAVWISYMNGKILLLSEVSLVAVLRGYYFLPARKGARLPDILTRKAAA